jgi:hypothetical protein
MLCKQAPHGCGISPCSTAGACLQAAKPRQHGTGTSQKDALQAGPTWLWHQPMLHSWRMPASSTTHHDGSISRR